MIERKALATDTPFARACRTWELNRIFCFSGIGVGRRCGKLLPRRRHRARRSALYNLSARRDRRRHGKRIRQVDGETSCCHDPHDRRARCMRPWRCAARCTNRVPMVVFTGESLGFGESGPDAGAEVARLPWPISAGRRG